MPNLFDHLDAVRQVLTASPFGLITDVDGTVSEIAPSPEEARVSPVCREQLAILTKRLELVAAISGRPALEVRQMLGVEEMVYIGNHGLEQWRDGAVRLAEEVGEYPTKVAAVLDELAETLTLDGILFENKTVGLSIHYRRCPDTQYAKMLIMDTLTASSIVRDFRIQEGKMLIELRPLVEIDKGVAVKALMTGYHLRGGIYLGDDISDVDAFRAMHQKLSGQSIRQAKGIRNRYHPASFKGLAIGVLGEETPQKLEKEVDFTVNGVGEVERFLAWLARVIPAPTRPRP